MKQWVGRRLASINRRPAHGSKARPEELMQQTQVELGRINTASIEWSNATLRTWLLALVRRTRKPSTLARSRELRAAADETLPNNLPKPVSTICPG